VAITGHYANLSEAQKLVQDKLLISGIIEEIIEEGQLLPRLPVFTIDSKSIVYNRESTLPSASFYDIGEQIPWKADVSYATQVELSLKRIARQDVLDNFVMKTYRNPNDYRALILSELRKGCMRTIEDKLIYGNSSTDSKEFDGLCKLVDSNMRTSMAGALSLAKLRAAIDKVRPKPDLILMPFELQRRMDAAMWEAGISANSIIRVASDPKGLGDRVTYFEGIPILPSDYLVAEANDGVTKYTTGTKYYSVYLMRLGQIQSGGVCMAIGGDTGGPDFFHIVELDELEDYDAGGIRLVAYCALALGSTKALYQIYATTDAAIVA
jgi:hypothetical protein